MKTKIDTALLGEELSAEIGKLITGKLAEAVPELEPILKDCFNHRTAAVEFDLHESFALGLAAPRHSDAPVVMPEKVRPLSRRLTRKYRAGWSHLDRWLDNLGTVKIVFEHVDHTLAEDGDPSFQTSLLVRVESDLRDPNIARCLEDLFGGSSCTHEHDCCGCYTSYVTDTTRVLGDLWRVKVSHHANV